MSNKEPEKREGWGADYGVDNPLPKVTRSRGDTYLKDGPQEAKQTGARLKAFESLLGGLANRQEPTGKVEYISLDQANTLMQEYKQAREEGYQDKDLDIIPLSAYHSKILPEGRPAIRPLMENEFGIIHKGSLEGTILCVKDGTAKSSGPVLLPGPGEK